MDSFAARLPRLLGKLGVVLPALIAVLVLAFATAAGNGAGRAAAASEPFDLTVLHTNDGTGYVEPCG